MRIIVNGQQAFGKSCLEAIIEKGEDQVVAVYTAPDTEGRPFDPIKQAALDHGLPVVQPANYSDDAVLDEMRGFDADLMVMAFMIVFVPEAAREIPSHGSICFHPSLLPLHRGPSSINWPIIWGATKTGLTLFWPDDGLDEGAILLQKEVEIEADDTLGSVYFKKIFPLGIEAVLESIELIRAGNPPRIVQDEALATYESWCRAKNVEIDWWRSAGEVHNLIRGADPAPGAWTTHGGKTLQLFDCTQVAAAGRPGQVTEISETGMIVVAGLGGVRIGRVRFDGGAKVSAAEFAAEQGLESGTRLGR